MCLPRTAPEDGVPVRVPKLSKAKRSNYARDMKTERTQVPRVGLQDVEKDPNSRLSHSFYIGEPLK